MVSQMVKDLPAMQETQVPSLGREDPLEKGIATHFSIHAWEILWTEEPGGLRSIASQSQTRLKRFSTPTRIYAKHCAKCLTHSPHLIHKAIL